MKLPITISFIHSIQPLNKYLSPTIHQTLPLSLVPQIWTDYKKDELASIYKGKGTQKEKQAIYDLLMGINASQSSTWEKINQ